MMKGDQKMLMKIENAYDIMEKKVKKCIMKKTPRVLVKFERGKLKPMTSLVVGCIVEVS